MCIPSLIHQYSQLPVLTAPGTCHGFYISSYGSGGKELACNVGNIVSTPGSGRSPGQQKKPATHTVFLSFLNGSAR